MNFASRTTNMFADQLQLQIFEEKAKDRLHLRIYNEQNSDPVGYLSNIPPTQAQAQVQIKKRSVDDFEIQRRRSIIARNKPKHQKRVRRTFFSKTKKYNMMPITAKYLLKRKSMVVTNGQHLTRLALIPASKSVGHTPYITPYITPYETPCTDQDLSESEYPDPNYNGTRSSADILDLAAPANLNQNKSYSSVGRLHVLKEESEDDQRCEFAPSANEPGSFMVDEMTHISDTNSSSFQIDPQYENENRWKTLLLSPVQIDENGNSYVMENGTPNYEYYDSGFLCSEEEQFDLGDLK